MTARAVRHGAGLLLAALLLAPSRPAPAAQQPPEPDVASAPAGPTLLETLWGKGEQALNEGKTDEARVAFQEALSLDPANGRTLNYLGGVFFVLGDWSQALLRFKQAAQATPDDPKVLNNLATAYDKLERYPEAIENYLAALDLAPDYPVPYRNLGAIYAYKTRDLDMAEKYWATFLKLVPDSPERSAIFGELERLKKLR